MRSLTTVAIGTLGVDTGCGVLAILGLLDDVDFGLGARVLAVLIVVAVVATVLVPLLRRLNRDQAVLPAPTPAAAAEIGAIAARLARADLPPAARADVERLIALARDLQR